MNLRGREVREKDPTGQHSLFSSTHPVLEGTKIHLSLDLTARYKLDVEASFPPGIKSFTLESGMEKFTTIC